MPAGQPDLRVECAFGSPTSTAFRDISEFANLTSTISFNRGRNSIVTQPETGELTLTLDNTDGRFSPANTLGPYYLSGLGIGVNNPIRVRARWPLDQSGNMLDAESASMETDVGEWVTETGIGLYPTTPTLARSTAQAYVGSASLLVSWPTAAAEDSAVSVSASDFVIGRSYTFRCRVYIPTGSPDVKFGMLYGLQATSSAVRDAWQELSVEWAPSSAAVSLVVTNAGAATSGESVYIDAVHVDETAYIGTGFTTDAPPTYDLFNGFVREWPIQWPGSVTSYAESQIRAVDRLRFLGSEVIQLGSLYEEAVNRVAPVAYYTLGSPSGSTSESGTGTDHFGRTDTLGPLTVQQRGSGGTLEFGASEGIPGDGQPAPLLTRVDASNGKYLSNYGGVLAGAFGNYTSTTLNAWMRSATTAQQAIVSLADAYGTNVELRTSSTGKAEVRVHSPWSGELALVTGTTTITSNSLHMVTATLTYSTGVVTVRLYVNGVEEGTADTYSWASLPNVSAIYVGGGIHNTNSDITWNQFNGTISHVSLHGTTGLPLTDWYQLGTRALVEYTGERIERLLTNRGLTSTGIDTGAVHVGHQETNGRGLLDVLREIALTDAGILFADRAGAIRFQSVTDRYTGASALTVSLENDIHGAPAVTHDDRLLSEAGNEIEVSTAEGTTFTAHDNESISTYGKYQKSQILLTPTSHINEAKSWAEWTFHRYGTVRSRVAGLSIEGRTAEGPTWSELMALDVGTKITLTDLPSQAGGIDTTLFVESINVTISESSWLISMTVGDGSTQSGWILGTSTLGTDTRLSYGVWAD